MSNQWLKDYGKRIENMNYTLNECIMRGSSDGGNLNLEEVLQLFRGSIAEIKALQLQVETLKESLIKKVQDEKSDE